MHLLLRCVGEAVVAKGVKGLFGLVPGGEFLFDLAADAARRYREASRGSGVQDVAALAGADAAAARAAVSQVAAEVAGHLPPAQREAVELYLSQVPSALRRSLRRPEDPTGKTAPAGTSPGKAEDLLRMLPTGLPRFRPGDRVPGAAGWTLREPLGTGGFGEVWKAGHDVVPEFRAVKFCTDPASRQRLLTHEGRLVARVMGEGRHAHVVPLVDAHLEGDAPWLAYEYVAGGDLTLVGLTWQKLAPEERVRQVVKALRQLATTAGYFHSLTPPLVHRDLKPANILFDGAAKKLRITDFGIGGLAASAELQAETQTRGRTAAGSLLAGSHTPLYASPQQRAGGPPDPRDDVHALGVIAYQLLTGKLDQAPGPRFERDLRSAGVTDDLARLVGDCIDPEAESRPRDGSDLAARLAGPAADAPRPRMPSPPPPPPPVPDQIPDELPVLPFASEDEEPPAPSAWPHVLVVAFLALLIFRPAFGWGRGFGRLGPIEFSLSFVCLLLLVAMPAMALMVYRRQWRRHHRARKRIPSPPRLWLTFAWVVGIVNAKMAMFMMVGDVGIPTWGTYLFVVLQAALPALAAVATYYLLERLDTAGKRKLS